MKTDPRHEARKLALLKIYSEFFKEENQIPSDLVAEIPTTAEADLQLLKVLVDGVKENSEQVNKLITESAPEWPLDRIAKIDLAILQISVYELLAKEVSQSVVINEAVELAKEFGGENSGKFVNGVLGNVSESLSHKESKKEDEIKQY